MFESLIGMTMVVPHAPPRPVHPFLDDGPKLLYIDGKSVAPSSGRYFKTPNPSTGQVLATVAEGDATDIDIAVRSARKALDGPWARMKPAERQQIILRLADLVDGGFEELAHLETLDVGAPISRTMASKARIVSQLRFYAGLVTSIRGDTISNSLPGDFVSYTLREPIGVVGAIIPWNGPLVASTWKIGPVLATGCTLVLKPAEEAPLSPLRWAELCTEAGVPDGVVNVVPGLGEIAGAALSAHRGVDKVAFTGSHVTGQLIVQASARNLKRVSLELGGKSPNIVFRDADMDAAIPGAAMAAFANTGQICSAGSRLFVEEDIYDEFTSKVAAFGEALRVGPAIEKETQIGPLVSRDQLERVTGYLDIGKSEGATLLAGGRPLERRDLEDGFFVSPSVFAKVEDDMRIAREEIFGPVISAISFRDVDEVVKRANNTEFGLGAGVWTRDIGRAHRLAREIHAGSVWINCYQAMDPAIPFGGYKMSGYGREGGVEHLDEYLGTKAVVLKT